MPQWITFLAFTLVAWLSLTVGVGLLIGRLLSVAAAWRLRRRGPAPSLSSPRRGITGKFRLGSKPVAGLRQINTR